MKKCFELQSPELKSWAEENYDNRKKFVDRHRTLQAVGIIIVRNVLYRRAILVKVLSGFQSFFCKIMQEKFDIFSS